MPSTPSPDSRGLYVNAFFVCVYRSHPCRQNCSLTVIEAEWSTLSNSAPRYFH
eukprot:m.1649204 g.1649204  ORF g.1649204 m.1649204 type:complete len:53 (+) comp82167_c0_seq1:144-302(+)